MQSVLEEQLWIRFEALRTSVMEYIRRRIQADSYYKSYEGKMEITFTFPSFFLDRELVEEPEVNIHLDCSMLIPKGLSHCDWNAESFELALRNAEKDIYKWLDRTS